MSFETEVIDYLKRTMGFVSDVQLMNWVGISKDSLSGIRTGRLMMGESIRFALLDKWWMHVRQRPTEQLAMPDHASFLNDMPASSRSDFSAQVLAGVVRDRINAQTKAGSVSDCPSQSEMKSPDAWLLEAYKAYKGCSTDTELAALLGIKRQSISMVRAGRNRLGPIPLLKIYEDLFAAHHLGLPNAVQSSQALMQLLTQGRAQA